MAAENRSISNLIETAALRQLREEDLVSDEEMREILSDTVLLRRLKRGQRQARQRRGRFVG